MDKLSLNTLGKHIQDLRFERGLSLSKLAADAGIAKSNLSRIEQGNSNPTLDTIWRLAVQLNVPFGDLVAPISVPFGDNGVQVRLIDQGTDTPSIDAYWMSCGPHILRTAEAHSPGTQESITVISGELDVGGKGNTKLCLAGDTYTFAADQPHIYRAGSSGASLLLTVIYAKREDE